MAADQHWSANFQTLSNVDIHVEECDPPQDHWRPGEIPGAALRFQERVLRSASLYTWINWLLDLAAHTTGAIVGDEQSLIEHCS